MNGNEGGNGKEKEARQRLHDYYVLRRIKRATGEEIHSDDWEAYRRAKKLEEEGKVEPVPGESPKGRALRLMEDVLQEPSAEEGEFSIVKTPPYPIVKK